MRFGSIIRLLGYEGLIYEGLCGRVGNMVDITNAFV
jgi:hypothetical protein